MTVDLLGEHRHDGIDVAALPGVHVLVDDRAQPRVAERARGGLLALRRAAGRRWSPAPAGGRCSPTPPWSRAPPRPRPPRSRAPRAGSARRAGAAAGAGAPRRRPAPRSRGARSGPPARPARPAGRGARRDTDRSRPTRPAAGPGPSRGSDSGPWSSGSIRMGRRAWRVEAGVGRDPVQPGPHRAAALEAREPPPRAQQRVLEGVLGVVHRSQHPITVRVQFGPARLDEGAVRVLVAPAGRIEQGLLRRGHRPRLPGVEPGRPARRIPGRRPRRALASSHPDRPSSGGRRDSARRASRHRPAALLRARPGDVRGASPAGRPVELLAGRRLPGLGQPVAPPPSRRIGRPWYEMP